MGLNSPKGLIFLSIIGIEMSNILTYLQDQTESMVYLLRDWVNYDSPTHNKTLVDRLGQRIASDFAKVGAKKTVHRQPERGDHFTFRWNYGARDKQILLLGHFDTVWPEGEAERRPFSVVDGQAMGPGVSDMKAGLVVIYFAIRAIHALGLRPAQNIAFLMNSDEEYGSQSSRALIEAEANQSSVCLVTEPAINGGLTIYRKGVGRFTVTITGQAAHSGVDPEKGASAIRELAYQIQRLYKLHQPKVGTTINVGTVAGGTRPNVIAAEATAHIDLRVTTMEAGQEAVEAILGLKPQNRKTNISVTGGLTRPPFRQTQSGLALAKQAQAVGLDLGMNLELRESGGGSDGNFTAALGVPTLDGLGGVGAGSHALHEHTYVAELPKRAALLAELIMSL